jgi:hypothetical protein
MISPFVGPNHYDCISSPATPQTVYGDVGNSYHVGGGYQVIGGVWSRCAPVFLGIKTRTVNEALAAPPPKLIKYR